MELQVASYAPPGKVVGVAGREATGRQYQTKFALRPVEKWKFVVCATGWAAYFSLIFIALADFFYELSGIVEITAESSTQNALYPQLVPDITIQAFLS